ncbi:MAG: succinate dehydrogenase iron-sulfur subunit [Nitrososphaeraceae archaeon]|nr:succinate dehydrogenase iron-sulfur subunit [Nitrososphaeraceae archaeon]
MADSKSNNNIKNVNEQRITLKVYRENRSQKTGSHYDTFEVPYKKWTTVLDALLYVKSYIDPSVAIRYSCRMASCGSCGMKINGIPKLACYTKISELETSIIECAPLSNFPIIRDLVTDFSQFFNHHKDMQPYLQAKDNLETDTNKGTFSFYQSPEDVDKYLQFSYCIKCGLCSSACPTVGTDLKFPGPQALAQQYRYFADTRDESKNRLDIVDDRHGIWRCHFAGSCSKVCPKGVDPALGIQLLRSYVLGISKNDKVPAKRVEINNNANTEDSAIDSNS